MKQKLSFKEYVYVASMLFGMFFGAGNLIFPVYMGQAAGRNVWPAIVGFLVTGVGLPLLGVAALGISRSDGLFALSSKVNRPYAYFFTCLLYLTIGPFFAIPRCATVSFTVGLEQILPQNGNMQLYLLLFTVAFFIAALLFSLFPGKILTWVGKFLNPFFLLFLGILIIVALVSPAATSISSVEPLGGYAAQPFFTGFLEGYNTMDILAALAFGITIVQVIKDLGIENAGDVAGNSFRAGIFSSLLMAVIYALITVMGAASRGVYPTSENGGIALTQIAAHYFGAFGQIILAAKVTLACLKTSIGLVTSCAETFSLLCPRVPYRHWTVLFSLFPLMVSNLGLTQIITVSIPVLMFLYPLAITLILLTLCGSFFGNDRRVYVSVTAFTLAAAVLDLLNALPAGAQEALKLTGLLTWVRGNVPLFSLGLGWILPAALGLAVGLILRKVQK